MKKIIVNKEKLQKLQTAEDYLSTKYGKRGKLQKLQTAEDYLSTKYGKRGSDSRKEFNAKAMAWYYAEILKDARIGAGITQQQLAERVGKKREYIALLEKGETDMQLSTFLMITQAIGINVELTY